MISTNQRVHILLPGAIIGLLKIQHWPSAEIFDPKRWAKSKTLLSTFEDFSKNPITW